MKNTYNQKEKNSHYIDGRTLKKYYCIDCGRKIAYKTFKYGNEFNKELKNYIRKRDNYTCKICGISEINHLKKYNEVLHIHHIDYNKKNCEKNNLITLCKECHHRTNGQRKIWSKILKSKPKIIFTSGCWDLLHAGHLNIFLKAKNLGTYLIVGVSTDALIAKYKKIHPIICYKDRANLIKELKCVDKVVPQTKLVDIKQFKNLNADLFILGDDWKNNYTNSGINWLRKHNKIIFLSYTKRLSTSSIKRKIIKNAYEIIEAQSKR